MKKNGIGNVYEVTEQALQSVAALVEKDSRDIESIGILTEMAEVGCSCLVGRSFDPPPTSLAAQAMEEGGAWKWLELQARNAHERTLERKRARKKH